MWKASRKWVGGQGEQQEAREEAAVQVSSGGDLDLGSRNAEEHPDEGSVWKQQTGLTSNLSFLPFSPLPGLRNLSLRMNSLPPPPGPSPFLQRLGEGRGAGQVRKPESPFPDCSSSAIFSLSSPTATPKSSFDPHHRSQPSYERPSYLPPGPGLMLRQKSIGMSPPGWVSGGQQGQGRLEG